MRSSGPWISVTRVSRGKVAGARPLDSVVRRHSMQPRTRDNITYVVTVGAALLLILYSTGFFSNVARESPLTGEVVAVENVGDGAKEAFVQLAPGKVVRAIIPPACVVFAGQEATLYSSGGPFTIGPEYTILSSKEKE